MKHKCDWLIDWYLEKPSHRTNVESQTFQVKPSVLDYLALARADEILFWSPKFITLFVTVFVRHKSIFVAHQHSTTIIIIIIIINSMTLLERSCPNKMFSSQIGSVLDAMQCVDQCWQVASRLPQSASMYVVDVHEISFGKLGHHWSRHRAHDSGAWTTQILQCDQTASDASNGLFLWPVNNQFGYGLLH